jgi:hypothetical protein
MPLSLENEFRRVAPSSEQTKSAVADTDAILRAADEWVTAQEAVVAARQRLEKTELQEERADLAGAKLVVAIKQWRAHITSLAERNTRSQLRSVPAG